jgi:hypothetical protein
MPISYRIDPLRGLVFTTASGVLTDDDILDLKRRLIGDPDFRPGLRELSDVRAVSDLQVSSEGVQRMIAHDEAQAGVLDGHRLAIVASTDATFGMARMYQMFTEANLPGVRVFRDYDAAARGLHVSSEPDA